MSDEEPKFIAIDEKANHQIVHSRRFGKAHGATDETFDPGPEVDVLACNVLRRLFADFVLRGVAMPFVGAPPIGGIPCDAKRLQQRLELQKDRILPSPKNLGEHGPIGVVTRMPEPPQLRFLPHVAPHFIEL